jgi:hypothetical protein
MAGAHVLVDPHAAYVAFFSYLFRQTGQEPSHNNQYRKAYYP